VKIEPEESVQEDQIKEPEETVIDEPSLIPENIIKVEIEEKSEALSPINDQKHKSPTHIISQKIPSPNENLHIHSPATANVIHINNTSPPIESPNGSKYCSNCDISFTYTHTFIAHKKFYCKAKPGDRPTSNVSANAPSNVVNVTLATETSVL
jgi:hypothetical protein